MLFTVQIIVFLTSVIFDIIVISFLLQDTVFLFLPLLFLPLSFPFVLLELEIIRVSLVQSLSHVQLFVIPWTAAYQASLSVTSSRSLLTLMSIRRWCHPSISSSVVPFSSCHWSFPASGSFPVNWFFASGGQSIGVLASASVLPMNVQDWFPLGWTGLISLQSKGLSRVFSNTTVQKHQFFGIQFSF